MGLEMYLNNKSAAAHIHRSESWLNKSRCSGNGPKFLKIGRGILYAKTDLDAFLESCRRNSTSDDGGSAR